MLRWIGAILGALLAAGIAEARPRTILFIGNSFTQGAHSAVARYGADRVTDLNRDGYGGVPALFATFARATRQDWVVSLETQGGQSLRFHYDERRARFDRRWDAVVLQEYSTLDRDRPGDPTGYRQAATQLAELFRARNPAVALYLTATWTRADLTWLAGARWSGRPVTEMARDLRRAADSLCAAPSLFAGVLPVGDAWNRAFATALADPNPYDGLTLGQVNLWAYDHYHASIHGYYLEALVVFARVTGVDPRTLGAGEVAARDLGIEPRIATALQRIAAEEVAQPDLCRRR